MIEFSYSSDPKIETLKSLLKRGLEVNIKDYYGESALTYLCKNKNAKPEVLELMVLIKFHKYKNSLFPQLKFSLNSNFFLQLKSKADVNYYKDDGWHEKRNAIQYSKYFFLNIFIYKRNSKKIK